MWVATAEMEEQQLRSCLPFSRQSGLSKWHFLVYQEPRTAPGSMHLSTGAENKSLVDDASKGIHQSDSMPAPSERPPGQQVRNACLFLDQHPNVPNLQSLPSTPLANAATGNS